MRLAGAAAALALALGLTAVTVQGQDLTSLLSTFLQKLYQGTLVIPPVGSVSLSGADQPMISSAVTWNNAGTTFTGWKSVITDTASGASSLALQILGGAAGSTTLLSVDKNGNTGIGGAFSNAAAGGISWTTRSVMKSSADGQWRVTNNGQTTGIELTFGADVSVNTCGTGAQTTGSKNAAGEVTATGATACTVAFATPTFTNKPFCIAVAESGTNPTVTVSTNVSFTVTGLTSGAAFMYQCMGRI